LIAKKSTSKNPIIWKCRGCSDKEVIVKLKNASKSSIKDLAEVLAIMYTSMNAHFTQVKSDISNVKNEVGDLRENLKARVAEEVHSILEPYKAEQESKLNAANEKLSNIRYNLNEIEERTNSKIKKLEKNKVQNCLIFTGIKLNKINYDTIFDALSLICSDVDIDLCHNDLSNINWHVNKKNEKITIFCKFNSFYKKNLILRKKKDLQKSESHKNIVIFEQSSDNTIDLKRFADGLKAIGYAAVYIRNDEVFVKRNLTDKNFIHIKTKEQVNELLEETIVGGAVGENIQLFRSDKN
jgi:hypothetical protein